MRQFKDFIEEVKIDESADSALAKKAEKSGVSLSILKKVYRRGVAAWNSGHRPGTTPQQWGMARVNSYITKGKGTYHGADKDLREEMAVFALEEAIDAIDQGEYDYEGAMSRTQLQTIMRSAKELIDTLRADENMPEWVQSKITKAEDYLSSVRDYMMSRKELGESESWEAGYKRRVVKTTDADHKEKGYNWRIKGKERPEISIKLYKEKPSQAEFNKQMKRVAGHEFGEETVSEDSRLKNDAYHKGLSDSTAKARVAHWKKMDKLSDRDPKSYQPAPGDATAKTKESKHTKKYHAMYGEETNPEVASTYKRIAVQHLKDMMSKDASNSSKIYAKKMHQRALEASKMSNHTDALNHYRGMKEEIEQVKEGYGEDDIAVGGTAIYKHDGKHHMSKVSHKTGGGASTKIHTKSGHVVPLHHVVSTDASDWNHFKDKAVKEEVEQVDELNKKTLASYVSKAAGSYGRDKQLIGRTSPDGTVKSADPDLKRAVKNRLTGINRAAERLAKEEASPMIKAPTNEFGKKEDAFSHAKEHGGKVFKKTFIHPTSGQKNVSYVVRKESVAEEIEQIDELSPELMRRTADKYQDKINRSKHPAETDKLLDKQARMSGQARRNELGKRYKDGGLAARKEEVEHIDEISQATKDSYAKKAKAEVDELKSHVKGEYGGIVKRMIARRKKGLKLAQKKTSE